MLYICDMELRAHFHSDSVDSRTESLEIWYEFGKFLFRTLFMNNEYRKTSNIKRTPVANKIVDHSDVVGA